MLKQNGRVVSGTLSRPRVGGGKQIEVNIAHVLMFPTFPL